MRDEDQDGVLRSRVVRRVAGAPVEGAAGTSNGDQDRVIRSRVVRRVGGAPVEGAAGTSNGTVGRATTTTTATMSANNSPKPVPPIPITREPESTSGPNTGRSTPEHNTAL